MKKNTKCLNIVLVFLSATIFMLIILPWIYEFGASFSVKALLKVDETERFQSLQDILTDLLTVSNELDIEVIPIYGTLLGMIREKDIIKHDYDVDVFVPDYHWKKLKDNFNKFKLSASTQNVLFYENKIKVLDPKTGLSADVAKLIVKDNTVYKKTLYPPCNDLDFNIFSPFSISYKKDTIYPLKKTKTKYGFIHLPNKSVELLEKWYGKDWTVPKPK